MKNQLHKVAVVELIVVLDAEINITVQNCTQER
jgi:hypothetical protein